jgi:hypothetical protein
MSLIVRDDDVKGNVAGANGFETTGRSSPLGATVLQDGANFSLFSRRASGVELLFFDHEEDTRPARVISIESAANRTYHYWHAFVPGVQAGQLYAYRVQGPYDPSSGLRFDSAKVLLDPYGRGVVVPKNYSRDAARAEGNNAATAMKSVVVDPQTYDWEGDTPLQRSSSRTICRALSSLHSSSRFIVSYFSSRLPPLTSTTALKRSSALRNASFAFLDAETLHRLVVHRVAAES